MSLSIGPPQTVCACFVSALSVLYSPVFDLTYSRNLRFFCITKGHVLVVCVVCVPVTSQMRVDD